MADSFIDGSNPNLNRLEPMGEHKLRKLMWVHKHLPTNLPSVARFGASCGPVSGKKLRRRKNRSPLEVWGEHVRGHIVAFFA